MWIRIVSLIARLGLAAVWLVSGWIKFSDPTQTIVAVRAYQLLPEVFVRPVAAGLPVLELVLGLLLLIGMAVRPVAAVSAAVLVTLIVAIVSAWSRGLSIDCGCFGGGGLAEVDDWDYARGNPARPRVPGALRLADRVPAQSRGAGGLGRAGVLSYRSALDGRVRSRQQSPPSSEG